MKETTKQMWDNRAHRVDQLRQTGRYCTHLLSHMTDHEVAAAYHDEARAANTGQARTAVVHYPNLPYKCK